MAKKLKIGKGKQSSGAKPAIPITNQMTSGSSSASKCSTGTKAKFSAEDEARIQAELDRIKQAKHEQMIAEEIRNRLANA